MKFFKYEKKFSWLSLFQKKHFEISKKAIKFKYINFRLL